jgi:putative FmdB family regulatory protein
VDAGRKVVLPTYEYECQKCGGIFDHFQSMSDEPLKKCILDGCKGKVKRLISAGAGLIFKGNGFYETDYKKKSGAPESCPASESKSCPNKSSCPAASKED